MFSDFQAFLELQDRSTATLRSYLSDLNLFGAWFEQTNGEGLTPQVVTSLDVRDYRQHLLTVKQRQASTVNRHLASISAWLNWAVDTDQIGSNPARRVNGVRTVALSPKWLARADEGALLRQAERTLQAAQTDPAKRQATRNQALVVLLLNTGLRSDEACSLEISDLEMGERQGILLVRSGKGRKQRRIPLNKQARQALSAWLLIRPDAGDPGVFLGRRGNQLSTSALRRIVSDLAYAAKLDPQEVSPHTLRHTFAKRLVDQSVSLEKVAALLGHSNLNTTRIYLTPGQQDLTNAVETLEY